MAAVVRTTASNAAVDGRGRRVRAGAGRPRERLEELDVGFGRAELVGQVRLHEVAGTPGRQGVGDGRQRHRELPLNVAVLLRVGSQLALGEGAGFPATVKGVRKQVTPDNRLRQHLVNRLSVHRRTLSAPRRASTGRAGSGSGHNRGVLTLVWFIVGGLVGWGSAHGGPAVQRAWPVFLRVQILATSATLSLVAAWRLTSVGQLLGPLALSAGMWLLLGATLSPGASGARARARWRRGPSPPTPASGWSRPRPPSPDRPGR